MIKYTGGVLVFEILDVSMKINTIYLGVLIVNVYNYVINNQNIIFMQI